jgi:hypothetical protein
LLVGGQSTIHAAGAQRTLPRGEAVICSISHSQLLMTGPMALKVTEGQAADSPSSSPS